MAMEVPVIDVSSLLNISASHDEVRNTVSEIGRACRDVGFFYAKNHNIPSSMIHQLFTEAEIFFSQAQEKKDKYAQNPTLKKRGYFNIGADIQGDLKEAYDCMPTWEKQDSYDVLNGQELIYDTNLPQTHEFKATVLNYFKYALSLSYSILQAFQMDLKVEPNFFRERFNKPSTLLRLLHYPPTEQGCIGNNEHTDYGSITILAQDNVGGLQIKQRNDSQWVNVAPIPDTLIINVGDMLARLTNDDYKATPHRVIRETSNKSRYSVPFFLEPNFDCLVDTLESCVTESNPKKYPPIVFGDYLGQKLSDTYERADQQNTAINKVN